MSEGEGEEQISKRVDEEEFRPSLDVDHALIPKDEKTAILEKIENLKAKIQSYDEDYTMKSSSSKKFPDFNVKLTWVSKLVNVDSAEKVPKEEPEDEEEEDKEADNEEDSKQKKKEKKKAKSKAKPKKETEVGK